MMSERIRSEQARRATQEADLRQALRRLEKDLREERRRGMEHLRDQIRQHDERVRHIDLEPDVLLNRLLKMRV